MLSSSVPVIEQKMEMLRSLQFCGKHFFYLDYWKGFESCHQKHQNMVPRNCRLKDLLEWTPKTVNWTYVLCTYFYACIPMKKLNSFKNWECVSMEGPLPSRQEALDSISTVGSENAKRV